MTTAAVVAYHSLEEKARVSYAGHPPILYRRSGERAWSYAKPSARKSRCEGFPINIPLAIDLDTLYDQFVISMASGDRLFVYTDGIIDTPNLSGESFGLARLKDVLDANLAVPLSDLKASVLKALKQYSRKALTHDDITMIALEII